MKKDIANRGDLLQLVKKFYEKLLADGSISYLFTDIAKINLEHHLPVLVDFWDSILFQSGTYQKNAMQPHMALHQKSPLTNSILKPGPVILKKLLTNFLQEIMHLLSKNGLPVSLP